MLSPELLRRFSLFAGVDPAVFTDLAMMGEELTFEDEEWLFHEQAEADSLFLILDGTVELKIRMMNGSQANFIDLSTMVVGDVIGFSGLVDPYEYTLGAVAVGETTVARLDTESLREYMTDNPALGYHVMTNLTKALGERLTNLRVQFVSLTLS